MAPDDPATLADLAATRYMQGEISEAATLYQAAARKSDSADLHKKLAATLFLDERIQEGIIQLRRAVSLDPSDIQARRLLADALAFDRDPGDPSADPMRRYLARSHLDVSVALRDRGQKAPSDAHLRQALTVFPTLAAAHNELGTRLVQDKRWNEAAAEFELSLRLDASSALAHNNLGYVLYREGRPDAAIEQYREALRLQPAFPLAQDNLREALRAESETKGPDLGPSARR
jgi:Flp pilus assembly protein TadD